MTRKIITTDTDYPTSVPNGTIMTVVGEYGSYLEATVDGGGNWVWNMFEGTYEEYAPKPPAFECDTPKLWRDMTPEEKGALLLAHHEGKEIECCLYGMDEWFVMHSPSWLQSHSYRIKPQPKVEVERVTIVNADGMTIGNGTVTTRNGKPDPSSIEMTAL